MQTFIALLRGINVGGHKKVPMAELRELLSNSGFLNVKTYIQSGNVVFQSTETNSFKIEHDISRAIKDHFGFDVPVLVRTPEQIKVILNHCPFTEDDMQKSYFMLLDTIPDEELVKIASQKVYDNEYYHIINDCIYFYCPAGYGKAKFNMSYFEKKLQANATSRNYKTVTKLLSLCDNL